MECLDERGVGDKGRSGKGWRDLGEVVLHVARRVRLGFSFFRPFAFQEGLILNLFSCVRYYIGGRCSFR